MYELVDGCHRFTCDNCGETEEWDADFTDFLSAKDALKDQGWQIRKDDTGHWVHICPACLEDDS